MKGIRNVVRSDVLIIGGGLAGCMAAIEASQALGEGGKVVIVDKGHISRSGQSPFAAGIFTVFDPEEDDMDVWLKEMIVWGEYLNDQAWVKQLFEQVLPVVQDMEGWASTYGKHIFEKDANGKFVRRRSRAHLNTKHNVVNSLPMMDTLRRKMNEQKIHIVDRVMITDLVEVDGVPVGAVGFNYWDENSYYFHAKTIVVAASGSGFKSVFLGHQNLTGDILAAAFEVGATLRNMEQYSSNTTARDFDIHGLNLYVGVGGKFLNRLGEEFMWKYHPDLGSRARLQDLVLAFCREVAEGRGPVYLDMRDASPSDQELCRKILPESFRLWDRAGVDPFEQQVEWIPAFYGTLISGGGLHVNMRCETNVPRLYAAGDITCIPPHGTYSIGGINLAFSAVSGRIAGRNAGEESKSTPAVDPAALGTKPLETLQRTFAPLTHSGPVSIPIETAVTLIQQAIIPSDHGYLKSGQTIADSLKQLEKVRNEVLPQISATSSHDLVRAIELRSMTTVATTMAAAAQFREESRGWHFRTDFPRTDNEKWLNWVMLNRDDDRIKITTKAVETPFVAPSEPFEIPPGMRRD